MLNSVKTLKEEWPKVKDAPYSFIICLLVGICFGAGTILFLYCYFVIPDKDAQISLLQQKKDSLIDEQKQNHLTSTKNTKQDIRILLESINPEILRAIDAGQRDILVMMNIPTEVRLLNLSERPDFNKYLSIKQSRGGKIEDYIIDSNDMSWKADYHLCPQDALIK